MISPSDTKSHRLAVGRAALAGAATSMRNFSSPAALVVRGELGQGRLRAAVLVLAAGELAVDKAPFATDRTDPPAYGGRIVTGALVGLRIGGRRGAVAGAAAAAVGTRVSYEARKRLVERTGWPDPAVAVGEDALALGAAAFATRRPG